MTALAALAAWIPFQLTVTRCATDPPGDTDSTWRFSGYCKAFHSLHLFNYPDSVTGGGLLNAVFLLPALIIGIAAVRSRRGHRVPAFRTAVFFSGALAGLFIVLALTLASATFPGDG